MVQLDVVDFLEILSHIGFAKRFLVRFFGGVSKRKVDIVKVSSYQEPIHLVGPTVVVSDDSHSALIDIRAIVFGGDFILSVTLSQLVLNDLHNGGLVHKPGAAIDVQE